MQFSLTDLDAMLKAHLRPAVESGRFQTMHADAVLADLLTLIEYNTASAQYDFSASEARLQQLFQHDQEQVQLYMQQQQQQQQQSAQAGPGNADAATAAPASAVASTLPPSHRQASVATAVAIDPFALDAEDERFLRGAFDLCLAEFDSDRDGAVDTRWSLGQCLRAAGLGLDVNERELADAIERIDRNKTGLADYTVGWLGLAWWLLVVWDGSAGPICEWMSTERAVQ
jgi:hypothetical protein